MPFSRPTLSDLRQRVRAFIAARLPGADLTLRRSNLRVIGDVQAGLTNGEYGYLDYLIRQNFTDTAEGEYLLRKGAMYQLYPTGAVQAAGPASFPGTNGFTLPAGSVAQDATGNSYTTQADATVSGGAVAVTVEANAGGAAQNLPESAPLTLVVAVAGINANGAVTAPGLTGGADEEDIEAFRTRVLARQSAPPQGGDAFDYVAWAKTVPGVTRAWIYPLNRGGGTVDLTFVMDSRDDIVPLTADIDAVQAVIEANQPVTDNTIVFAATPSVVNFTITGAFTDAQKTAITASLDDLFHVAAVPGDAYNPATQGTFDGGLSFQDQLVPAVAAGAGDTTFVLTAPSADIAGSSGVLLTRGTITFVP